jgi:hypothetical protein
MEATHIAIVQKAPAFLGRAECSLKGLPQTDLNSGNGTEG